MLFFLYNPDNYTETVLISGELPDEIYILLLVAAGGFLGVFYFLFLLSAF
ncbi:MAG: hypothetical protein JSV04_15160 [Candidatus Heimdallarchaeota archaeon]|nr:MAG: hypothetical protein JSV04_15160 [Candidatus Heimdallarchaeota archaeon]